jgi:hypothetical protein
MSKQNIKLTIMFILGLPALPITCVGWLFDRYIVSYNLPPEQRSLGTKEGFIAHMCAMTFFFGGLALLWYKLR